MTWGSADEVRFAVASALLALALVPAPVFVWFGGLPPKKADFPGSGRTLAGSEVEFARAARASDTLRAMVVVLCVALAWTIAVGLFWALAYDEPKDYFDQDSLGWGGLAMLMLLLPVNLGIPVLVAIGGPALFSTLTGWKTSAAGFAFGALVIGAGVPCLYWLFANSLAGNVVWWITFPLLALDVVAIVLAAVFSWGRPRERDPGAPG